MLNLGAVAVSLSWNCVCEQWLLWLLGVFIVLVGDNISAAFTFRC